MIEFKLYDLQNVIISFLTHSAADILQSGFIKVSKPDAGQAATREAQRLAHKQRGLEFHCFTVHFNSLYI
jgi:hypothetical protein